MLYSNFNHLHLQENNFLSKIRLLLRNGNACNACSSAIFDVQAHKRRKPVVSSPKHFGSSETESSLFDFRVTAAGCWHISKVIGIKWTLRGAEMLSKDRTCVIVANHQSSLDIQGMIGKIICLIRSFGSESEIAEIA